jgi:hypothetical protein
MNLKHFRLLIALPVIMLVNTFLLPALILDSYRDTWRWWRHEYDTITQDA